MLNLLYWIADITIICIIPLNPQQSYSKSVFLRLYVWEKTCLKKNLYCIYSYDLLSVKMYHLLQLNRVILGYGLSCFKEILQYGECKNSITLQFDGVLEKLWINDENFWVSTIIWLQMQIKHTITCENSSNCCGCLFKKIPILKEIRISWITWETILSVDCDFVVYFESETLKL